MEKWDSSLNQKRQKQRQRIRHLKRERQSQNPKSRDQKNRLPENITQHDGVGFISFRDHGKSFRAASFFGGGQRNNVSPDIPQSGRITSALISRRRSRWRLMFFDV